MAPFIPGVLTRPEATAGTTDTGTKQLQPYDGFTGRPQSLGLLPSGADASVEGLYTDDGGFYPGGPATGPGGLAPGDLPGNLGLFGAYGPNAFNGSFAPGAFGETAVAQKTPAPTI